MICVYAICATMCLLRLKNNLGQKGPTRGLTVSHGVHGRPPPETPVKSAYRREHGGASVSSWMLAAVPPHGRRRISPNPGCDSPCARPRPFL